MKYEYELPNHMKLSKKDKKDLQAIKKKIAAIPWYKWLVIGLACGFLFYLSMLL